MYNLFLRERNNTQLELMDNPDCDIVKLNNTYKNFELINQIFSSWRHIYINYVRPLKPKSLLDIGCGGGDLARIIAKWAKQDSFDIQITAIDPNEQALAFARKQDNPANLQFLQATSSDLVKNKFSFDVVISNHLLHHLSAGAVLNLCTDSKRLAKKRVLHNDLRRSDLAYFGFIFTYPFFLNSFVTPDGLLSIKRSFTRHELADLVPENWQVKSIIPYRNLLLYDA